MRLDRVVSEHTTLTRSEIKKRILSGSAAVDGQTVRKPETKVDPQNSRIEWEGVPLSLRAMYLMMNKPQGVVSATRDTRLPTALDLVPPAWRRKGLFPAGRLDRDTEGFLLITDDGDFAHRILSPKRHVPKEYLARVEGVLRPDAPALFKQGVLLDDGTVCRPAQLDLLPGGMARIVLHEGMYHQVKRMIACCGGEVTLLRRVRIGGLLLDGTLPPAACRVISPQEIILLETGIDGAFSNEKAL